MGFFDQIKERFSGSRAGNAAHQLKVDLHSHLLPGIDDGSKTLDESLAMIQRICSYGVEHIITTPHVMYEFYRNTPEIIRAKRDEVRAALKERGVNVRLDAAAEYYLDDDFLRRIQEEEDSLLTFGNKMVLIETNYIQDHPMRAEAFFQLRLKGFKPVFAHPERYLYLHSGKDFRQYHHLYDSGIIFQVNLMSFTGYYGADIKKVADYLLDQGMIHLVGSDIHRMEHVEVVNGLKRSKKFEKIMQLPLLDL